MTNEAAVPAHRDAAIIRAGGFSLVLAAVLFACVFSYLAARFDYPEVLDGRAADVLPALLATGPAGRAVWALYSLLPLLWIPSAIGAFHALRRESEGSSRLAMTFAFVSSIAMVLGLMRWPAFHWELARAWVADPAVRPALAIVFDAMNLYLGNFIGEFLGELCAGMFFLLSATSMLRRGSGFPRWIGWVGIAASVTGLIAMFRNVTPAVSAIAEANNYVLPLWMIVFGISLLRHRSNKLVPMVVSPAPAAA